MEPKTTNSNQVVTIVTWPLRIAKAFVKLPQHVGVMYQNQAMLEKTVDRINKINESIAALDKTAAKINDTVDELRRYSASLGGRFMKLEKQADALPPPSNSRQAVKATPETAERFADNHDLDNFYIGFEDRFRGSEEDIKSRVKIYPTRLKQTGIDFSKYPILDIGCGRGELLSAFHDAKVRAIGLDINFEMVERAQAYGLEAIQGDAIPYLRSLKSSSLGGITGLHLVEHIPFPELMTLFTECFRVLCPGGLVIFETPNPENLLVGAYTFYFDPSHLHPLPPMLTSFALESVGFDKVEILRLHDFDPDRPTYDDKLLTELSNRIYGAPDYAAIGAKPDEGKKPAPVKSKQRTSK